ncbi:MAG: hypothetical protein KatS3mg010_2041 [Acidimicrobiia bacterium]|nr:MAG: hypothetical protein KatS3mg010_2041 [Acidimicrobiia bacterium]
MPDDGTVVLIDCPDCGVGRVAACQVVLRSCVEHDEWQYRARCPHCHCTFVAGTTGAAAAAAAAAGASVEYWELPAELRERPSGAPQLTVDDVTRAIALLADDAALHAALRRLALR